MPCSKNKDLPNLGDLEGLKLTLAQKVMAQYHSNDPVLLAQQAGIRRDYARWKPVTYGEFDRKTCTITINLNAPLSIREILAHELGHYFTELENPGLDKAAHEASAEAFSATLISQTPFP